MLLSQATFGDWDMAGERDAATLGELCEFRAGSVFKPALQGKSSGSYPFVKVSDMNLPANAVRIQQANNWISEDDLQELHARPLPPGTVVFAKIGEALRQNRLRQLVRPTIVDNNMMGAVPISARVNPRFFYYILSQIDFSEVAQGTALPYLTISALSALRLQLPPLPEQRAIAEVLGVLDDKIEVNRRLNETLEGFARAIFKSWFVDFDPVRAKMEGRDLGIAPEISALFPGQFVQTENREVPAGWKSARFEELARPITDVVPAEELSPDERYIGLEHMPRRCITLAEWGAAAELSSHKARFRHGDILFGKLRPYFHKVGLALIDGVCSTDIVVLRPTAAYFGALALFAASSDDFVAFTDVASTGTKMPRTSWGRMREYDIALPTAEVAGAFQDLVEPMLDRIRVSVFQSCTLAALRDLLLPKLMSGELRVKDAERLLDQSRA